MCNNETEQICQIALKTKRKKEKSGKPQKNLKAFECRAVGGKITAFLNNRF